MSDEFAQHTGIQWNGKVGVVEYGGGDKGQVVMFYNKAVHSPGKSTNSGRPVYEDQIFVRIHPPGERLNIIDQPANEGHFRRWPQQYQMFRQNKAQVPDGTPIDLLFPEYPSIGAMLRASGVMTIEQCAELSGNAVDNIGMGAQRYVNASVKFLEMANKGVSATQFRHELEERDAQIRVMSHQMQEMQNTINALQKNNMSGAKLQEVQQLIAGVMGRPEHPAGGIDHQNAMIGANHTTTQITRAKPRAKPAPEPVKAKRERPKLKV